MTPFILPIDPAAPNQTLTVQVSPDGNPRLLHLSLRWLNAPGLWFLSLSDALNDRQPVNSIPLRASYGAVNDLLKPFRHYGLGSLCCFPGVPSPSTEDPGLHNLSEFQLIWSDTLK